MNKIVPIEEGDFYLSKEGIVVKVAVDIALMVIIQKQKLIAKTAFFRHDC